MINAIQRRTPSRVGRFRPRSFAVAAAVCMLLPAVAIACSVPVFRFALEQWRPDVYQVFVYHDQDLNEDQKQWVQQLEQRGAESGDTNVQVRTIDLRTEIEPADRHRWESLGEPALPHMVVHLPKGIGGGDVFVGSSAFEGSEVEALISSPARAELAQRLIDGDVVWVFLGSGDSNEDDARLTQLETELAQLQETLELPTIEQEDLKELTVAPEALAIRFSALHVDRDDPAEKWFVEMLLSSEPDLREEELVGQPMVFPVFGRGRALYALVGMGINADMIQEAAEFLTGPCQCTVKAENPGVDLLLPVRWDDHIVPTEPEEVDLPLVGLGSYTGEPETGLPIVDRASAPEQTVPEQSIAATTDKRAARPAGAADRASDEVTASDDAASDLSRGESAAADSSVDADAPAVATMASLLGQAADPVDRPASTMWLPWLVMILLGLAVTVASLRFFRRP